MTTCANESVRALFDTISKAAESANLGLDASHKVEAIPFLPASGASMTFQTVVKAYQSGIKDTQNIVVRDRASWEKLWIAHNPAMPDMPVIDFTRQMVVGVFAGEGKLSCGADLAIVQVGSKDGKVVVDYEERALPRPEVCLTVLTAPMHLVVLDRADAPVEFVKHPVAMVMAIALDDTSLSGVHTPGEVVVKDAAGWAALWAEHARKDRVLPEVDFGRDMVVGIFLGDLASGCPEIRIDNIVDDKTRRTVRYSVVQPIGVLCTANVKSPAQLLVLPRTELPIVFEKKLTSF
jgi:hypothetical protein